MGCVLADEAAGLEHEQLVAVASGEVQVVDGHQRYPVGPADLVADELEQFDLVA